jgi:hypothetical protein
MLQINEYWSCAANILNAFPCKIRLKWSKISEPSEWEDWLAIPTSYYLETGTLGPVLMGEVEWVEVNTIEMRRVGKLVKDRRIEHTDVIVQALKEKVITFQQFGQFLKLTYLCIFVS